MTKSELTAAVEAVREKTKEALQTIYRALNHGQQKQIIKHEEVKKLFDLYGVEYEE